MCTLGRAIRFRDPTTNAIMSLTVATYITQPFFVDCDPPDVAIRIIGATCLLGLTWLNCYSTKITTKLQNIFMFYKLLAVLLIIVIGSFAFLRIRKFSCRMWSITIKVRVSKKSPVFPSLMQAT